METYLADPGEHTLLEKSSNDHSHSPADTLCRQFLSNSVTRKAADDVSARPLQLTGKERQV